MKLYLRAFLLTLGVNALAILPFLLFYRVPVIDSLGLIVVVAAMGPCVQLKSIARGAIAPERKEEVVIMSALFLPMLALVLHALVWSVFHFRDTGRVIPDSATHRVAIIAAVFGFVAWCWGGLHFYPKRKTA